MSILEKVENMSAEEMQAADQDDLIRQIIACNVGDVARRYLQARTDAKIRDEKLAEQAETLTALKKGIEAITQQVVDADRAGDKLIKELEQQKAAMNETIDYQDSRIKQMGVDAGVELDNAVATLDANLEARAVRLGHATDKVRNLTEIVLQRDDAIAKLVVQANTYAEVIGRANAMFLEAMTAKAVADTAADAS